MNEFIGANLRLARLFHGLTLAELGADVGISKQFLGRVEIGREAGLSASVESDLCRRLAVLPEFFYCPDQMPIVDEQCHFRKQLTTKVALRQMARSRGEMLKRLVNVLDEHLELPAYRIFEGEPSSTEATEQAAERCRADWGLGAGPLQNLVRIAENAGAVVMRVSGLADEIDAVSFATRRPVIALNNNKRSACRSRFAVAHELGHFALHTGILTGDRLTEGQANRFASAFLMPRGTFAPECARAMRASRLNWPALVELKLRWGVSKAAILYRGRQLGIFNEAQVRGGYITLNRHGEANAEHEDHLVPSENPETIAEGLQVLHSALGIPSAAIARSMAIEPRLLDDLLGNDRELNNVGNVVPLFSRKNARPVDVPSNLQGHGSGKVIEFS